MMIEPQAKMGKMPNEMISTFPHDVQVGLAERKRKTKQIDQETGLPVEEDWPALKKEYYTTGEGDKARTRFKWVNAAEPTESKFHYHSALYSFNTNVRVKEAMALDNPRHVPKGCWITCKRMIRKMLCGSKATRSEAWLFRDDVRLIEGKFGSTIASYFLFARQLFTLNLVIAIFWGYFVNYQWLVSYMSPTYMADYWPESNLTESGDRHESRAFLGMSSLTFGGLLSGEQLEYSMAMFGGYRVPTSNETFRFAANTGPILNISGYNMFVEYNMSMDLSEPKAWDLNVWDPANSGANAPGAIELSNLEAMEGCTQQVYVCKSAVLDVVAAGTNQTEEDINPGNKLRSFIGWDATDLWYAIAIVFTYLYSIITIIEAIGDTYEERYDEEPDDFSYSWGPVVFGTLDFGVTHPRALTFFKDMFNTKLKEQKSKSDEKESFQELHCLGTTILYCRRLAGLLASILLITASVYIISYLTVDGAQFTEQLAQDNPSLASVASFAVPVFVAGLNIITPTFCKILVTLEKWDKETALVQTLWRVYIMKMVNVLVLVFASLRATQAEGFPERDCPENYLGKVFWKMVFTDTLVQFIVKIVVAGTLNSFKVLCTSLSLKQLKELCEKEEKMYRHEEQIEMANWLDTATNRLDKKHKKLDFQPERDAIEADEAKDAADKAAANKVLDRLEGEMKDFEMQVKSLAARAEFDVAAQIIDLMYKQCLIWCGTVYCPLLPALGTLNMLASFKITRYNVVNFGKNSEKNVGAGNSDRFNLDLLLATVAITFIPCTNFLLSSHQRCGPFTRFEGDRYMVFDFYLEAGFAPSSIKSTLLYLVEPLILLAIFVVLMLVLYFTDKVEDKAQRHLEAAMSLLSQENKEKKHLIALHNINLDKAMPEFEDEES